MFHLQCNAPYKARHHVCSLRREIAQDDKNHGEPSATSTLCSKLAEVPKQNSGQALLNTIAAVLARGYLVVGDPMSPGLCLFAWPISRVRQ